MILDKDVKKVNSAFAFEQMYILHYHKIRSFCNGYLKDEEESKCIAQEVFVAVWNNRESLVFNDDLLPYLFMLAKNQSLNVLKKNKVRQNHIDHSLHLNRESLNYNALMDNTINILYGKEVEGLFAEALKQMPANVKSTFLLSRFKRLKYEEIAKVQFISVKTVEYRMMFALRVLRKMLKDYLPIFLGYMCAKLF